MRTASSSSDTQTKRALIYSTVKWDSLEFLIHIIHSKAFHVLTFLLYQNDFEVCTMSLSFLLMVELKWFLMELSVLPFRNLAISAHLFPYYRWAWMIISSSYSVHFSFLISGFRWLCHLSLHCFPILPGRALAISDQFLAPNYWTLSYSI